MDQVQWTGSGPQFVPFVDPAAVPRPPSPLEGALRGSAQRGTAPLAAGGGVGGTGNRPMQAREHLGHGWGENAVVAPFL